MRLLGMFGGARRTLDSRSFSVMLSACERSTQYYIQESNVLDLSPSLLRLSASTSTPLRHPCIHLAIDSVAAAHS